MSNEAAASILWRRVDAEGHDACRVTRVNGGWRIEGVAAFALDGTPCGLTYSVECDRTWRTRAASVTGSRGDDPVAIQMGRVGADWLLNGILQADAAGLVDLDLGFTPATNLIAIRRLDLAVGKESPAPAAYLPFPALRLERLEQTYKRLDAGRYRYTAPAYGYDDLLTVAATGLVTAYPGLWRATD